MITRSSVAADLNQRIQVRVNRNYQIDIKNFKKNTRPNNKLKKHIVDHYQILKDHVKNRNRKIIIQCKYIITIKNK